MARPVGEAQQVTPAARRRRAHTTALVATLMAAPVSAASLEEVTVTATLRPETASEVTRSLSVLDAQRMDALGLRRSTDIVQQVPGLTLSSFAPTLTTFALRGVSQNNFQDHLEAPVAVQVDGAYVANMNAIDAQLFDLERVEVLKGPQGTLHGRNATGGLINFVTRGADDTQRSGYTRFGLGRFARRSAEGAFGGELVPGLRGRVAGRYERADGYIASDTPGVRDAMGADGYALRASFQKDLPRGGLADLKLRHAVDNDVPGGAYTVAFAGFDPATGFGVPTGGALTAPRRHASTLEGGFDRRTSGATLTLRVPLGETLALTSITAVQATDKRYLEDAGGGLVFFPYFTDAEHRQLSQELRLAGVSGPWDWLAGAYWLDTEVMTAQRVQGAAILAGVAGSTDQAYADTLASVDSRNASLFGELRRSLGERWSASLGLRWSQDRRDLALTRSYADPGRGVALRQTFDIASAGTADDREIRYGDLAARFGVAHDLTDTLQLHASWARGIKAGNFSIAPLDGAIPVGQTRHGEEVLHALELGARLGFWAGRGRLSVDLFRYDYRDYQVFSLVNLVPQVANADARAHGGELELALQPATGLDVILGAAFMTSRVDAVPTVFGGTVTAELPLAPKASVNWQLRQTLPLNETFDVTLGIDGRWNSAQFLEGTNSAVSREAAYGIVNLRLGLASRDERWRLDLALENATDTVYRQYNLDLGAIAAPAQDGFIEQVYGPPRMLAATLSARF